MTFDDIKWKIAISLPSDPRNVFDVIYQTHVTTRRIDRMYHTSQNLKWQWKPQAFNLAAVFVKVDRIYADLCQAKDGENIVSIKVPFLAHSAGGVVWRYLNPNLELAEVLSRDRIDEASSYLQN